MKLLDKNQALEKLNSMGLNINMRQLTRAASPNERNRRALPFFKDPITGKLVIEEEALLNAYRVAQATAIKESG
jgi:hypothetical protein